MRLLSFLLLLIINNAAFTTSDPKAQSCVTFNSMTYDFGDIYINDGPQKCVFIMKNTGDIPFSIISTSSSCGCTNVTYDKEILLPGDETTLRVIYKNADGPYPFDKSISVLTSLSKSPYILHIRGNVHKKVLSPKKMYPFQLEELGFENIDIKLGQVNQGDIISDSLRVYNFSKKESTFSLYSPLVYFEQQLINIPPKSFIYIPFCIAIPDTLIGYNSIPITLYHHFKRFTSDSFLSLSFQAIPQNLQIQEKSDIKIINKYISLGSITNRKKRAFAVNISNIGVTPALIYKIDLPKDIEKISSFSYLDVDKTDSIFFKITQTKPTKEKVVSIITIYCNSYQAIEHIYVSYYIPNTAELIFEKIRKIIIRATT
jgi:hypothetical protein